MKLGAQLFTLRDFAKTERDIDRTFERVAQIGYPCVQVSAIGEIAPEKLRDISKKHNLPIIVTHTNPIRIIEETDKVIEEHMTFGCVNIGIGGMPERYRGSKEGIDCLLADFDEAARKLEANGMKLHYHNHAFEFEKFGCDFTMYDYLVEKANPNHWGFILDTYWVHFAGRDVVTELENLKGRIEVLHLKDLKIQNGAPTTAAIYDGNMPFDAILAKAKELQIPYAMVEQDNCNGENPFAQLKLSYENLIKKI